MVEEGFLVEEGCSSTDNTKLEFCTNMLEKECFEGVKDSGYFDSANSLMGAICEGLLEIYGLCLECGLCF